MHGGRRASTAVSWAGRGTGLRGRGAAEVLGVVGLETAAKRRAGTFSLGMGQRLGLAAALLGDPPVKVQFQEVGAPVLWSVKVTVAPAQRFAVEAENAACNGAFTVKSAGVLMMPAYPLFELEFPWLMVHRYCPFTRDSTSESFAPT